MLGSFAGGLGFGLAFVLEDQFTDVADKIRGSMSGLDADAGKSADSVMGKFGQMAGLMGIGFSVSSAISEAAALSDQLVGVADVTNMTSSEIEGLRSKLENMDVRTSVPELLGLAQLGSQMGIAKDQLDGFAAKANMVGMVIGEDFGGKTDEAVKKMVQMGKAFKDTKGLTPEEQMMKLATAFDTMGDSSTANMKSVANFAQKIATFGDKGFTAGQALGLGTALEEAGIKAQSSVPKLNAVMKAMSDPKKMGLFAEQVGMSTTAFQNLFNQDPNAAILMLADSFKKQGLSSSEMFQRMKALGIPGGEMVKLFQTIGEQSDNIRKKQAAASDAIANGTGVVDEANALNQTFGAQLEKIQRNFQNLLTRIGEAIAGGFSPLFDIVNGLIMAFVSFTASPIGKQILKWTVSIVGLVGAAVGLAQGIKFVSVAFGTMTKAALKSLVALGPYLAIALPFILLVGVIYKAVNAFKNFNGEVQGGIGGFFQKLGGIIQAIQEVWSSWDRVNQTFSISGDTMEKLNKMGIGGLAVNIGTWIVRIKEYMTGLIEGLSQGFSAVWSVISPIFSAIGNALSKIGIGINKTTSSVKGWATAGKIVGFILVAVFTAIAIAAGIAAVNIIIAFLPVIIIIGLIAAGIYVLVKLWQWFMGVLSAAWDILGAMFDWGANLINYIWEGIKSAWKGFTGWLWSSVTSVPLVGPAIKWLFGGESADPNDSLGKAVESKAGSQEIVAAQEKMTAQGTTGVAEGGIGNRLSAMVAATSGQTTTTPIQITPQPVIVELDGEKIGQAFGKYNTNELSKQ